jgi:hypothetical protein
MHRHLITAPKGRVIDHINGDGLDNTKANLRLATPSQNAANSKIRRNSTTGFKGVWWDKKKKKYRASIWVDGKRFHLGYFHPKTKAAIAYDRAATHHFAQFARLNNPHSA